MDNFLEKLLMSSQQRIAVEQGDASKNFLAMLDRAFGKVYTEADPIETAAIRQIMMREAPINVNMPKE